MSSASAWVGDPETTACRIQRRCSDSVVTNAEPCESVGAVAASGHCAQRCLAIGGTEDFDGGAADHGSAVRLDGASDRARVCRQCLPCQAVVAAIAASMRSPSTALEFATDSKPDPMTTAKIVMAVSSPARESIHLLIRGRWMNVARTLRWQFNPVSLEGQRARHRGAEPWTSAGDWRRECSASPRLEPNGDGIEAIAKCLLVVGPEE